MVFRSEEPGAFWNHLREVVLPHHHAQRPAGRPPEKRTSCMSTSVVIGVVLVLLAVGYLEFIRPDLGAYVGEQVAQQFGGATPTRSGSSQQQILEERVGSYLPDAVAALPVGETRVSDTRLNEYLAANADQLAPLEQVTITFVPGRVEGDLVAYGITNHLSLGLSVQDGRIVAVDPQLEGPLALVISVEDLVRSLETQFNSQLADQGRVIHDIRIEQGEAVLIME